MNTFFTDGIYVRQLTVYDDIIWFDWNISKSKLEKNSSLLNERFVSFTNSIRKLKDKLSKRKENRFSLRISQMNSFIIDFKFKHLFLWGIVWHQCNKKWKTHNIQLQNIDYSCKLIFGLEPKLFIVFWRSAQSRREITLSLISVVIKSSGTKITEM